MKFKALLRAEATPGILLILTGILAMFLSNSSFSSTYFEIIHTKYPINVEFVINDVLMTIFFLYVGMEIKQQIISGHLSKFRQALLPVIAALGGVITPALIFTYVNWPDYIALRGWAIPTATDIAFALGVIILLGSHLPNTLKIVLLAIAVIDDLVAILIISLYYTHELSWILLLICAILIAKLCWMNYRNVRNLYMYLLVGLALWVCMQHSGVHVTISGVILAFAMPLSIQNRLHKKLYIWIAFLIMPLFALANAGVSLQNITMQEFYDPVPLGIALGLILGKQLGVFSFAWLSVKAKLTILPDNITWSNLYGMSILCGIGFTMSIFIGNLAYEHISDHYLVVNKLGVIVGSITSAVLGYTYLRITLAKFKERHKTY
jgi:NhaA family Na+:H+ antiporter